MKLEYIENNPDKGVRYDWKFIMKELHELIRPYVGTNYIPDPPFNSANWFVDLSERSVGKTTQYLLIGMLLHKHYGTMCELLRVKSEQIRPMRMKNVFNTIASSTFNYIEKLTDGKYNAIRFDASFFYYCKLDEAGKLDKDVPIDKFMHVEALANVDDIKSLYNSPNSDYIILDEFINSSGINKEEDFINLCHILQTYRRNRLSVKIVMMANTINPYSIWFHELCISEDIRNLKLGQEKIVKTPLGTNVWIHLVKFDERVQEERLYNNLQYLGFDNPLLASIVGGKEWSIKNYPHLPRRNIKEKEERKLLHRDIYFRYYGREMCCEIWHSSIIGKYMYIRDMPTEIDTSIRGTRIYTLETATSKLDRYGIGTGDKIDRLIWYFYNNERVFYSLNDVGNRFENYMNSIK